MPARRAGPVARGTATLIAEGVALIDRRRSAQAPLGPYQLQAAIAAVHDEAPSAEDTDWPQILALYELLDQRRTQPDGDAQPRGGGGRWCTGPAAGLDAARHPRRRRAHVADHHRLLAVRAHLLERAGDLDAARAAYRDAARRTTSRPEQRHLEARAARLS